MRAALLIGGLTSAGLAAYQFFLPHLWGWEAQLTRLPPAIHWGVHAINTFFSALLLAGGVLTLAMVRHGTEGAIARGLLLAMTLCWEISLIHQMAVPPPSTPLLRIAMLAISAVALVAYGYATVTSVRWHESASVQRPASA